MKTERVKNSVFNSISNVFIALTTTVLSFVLRTIFIKKLGEQCLGLEGLFTNILSLLSLAELGFSSAISFSLYEPLSKKDNKQLKVLMNYFKNVYRKIGITIFVIGIFVMPFLPLIANGYTVSYNIYLIFLLYLINTSSTYFTSYNSVLLEADQKNYKVTHIRLLFRILLYSLQLLIIVFYENFIIYLLVSIALGFIERIITYYYIQRMYKNISTIKLSNDKLDTKTKQTINQNIKGILFHRVGDFAVNGTDNILISSIINISTTGMYANYLSIVGVIKTMLNSLINSVTASFGNLNVEETPEVKYNVFKTINIIAYYMVGVCTICFFVIANDFITFWVGSKFLFSFSTVVLISINIYLACMLMPVNVVKNSTGLYYIDRYIGLLQAIINLVISVVFGVLFGLNGILVGTTISYITTVSWTKPYVIYKKVFNKSVFSYIKEFLIGTVTVLLVCLCCNYIFNNIALNIPLFIAMIVKCITCIVIFSILFIIIYHNDSQFKYIVKLLKRGRDR